MKTQNQNKTLMWSVREHRKEMRCYKNTVNRTAGILWTLRRWAYPGNINQYANRVSSWITAISSCRVFCRWLWRGLLDQWDSPDALDPWYATFHLDHNNRSVLLSVYDIVISKMRLRRLSLFQGNPGSTGLKGELGDPGPQVNNNSCV